MRGEEPRLAWLDEAVKAGTVHVGFDIGLNRPANASLGWRDPDGVLHVEPVENDDFYRSIVQSLARRAMQQSNARAEAFLRDLYKVSEQEERALKLTSGVYKSGRGHGKTLAVETVQSLMKRIEESPLPDNFWNTVAAHNMLEDVEGRRLVRAIVDKKLGLDSCSEGSDSEKEQRSSSGD